MIPRDLRIFQGRNQQGQRWPRSEARGAGNARCHGLAAAHGEAWRTAGAENTPGCNGLVKWVGKMGMSLEKDGYAIKSGFYSGSCSWPCWLLPLLRSEATLKYLHTAKNWTCPRPNTFCLVFLWNIGQFSIRLGIMNQALDYFLYSGLKPQPARCGSLWIVEYFTPVAAYQKNIITLTAPFRNPTSTTPIFFGAHSRETLAQLQVSRPALHHAIQVEVLSATDLSFAAGQHMGNPWEERGKGLEDRSKHVQSVNGSLIDPLDQEKLTRTPREGRWIMLNYASFWQFWWRVRCAAWFCDSNGQHTPLSSSVECLKHNIS